MAHTPCVAACTLRSGPKASRVVEHTHVARLLQSCSPLVGTCAAAAPATGASIQPCAQHSNVRACAAVRTACALFEFEFGTLAPCIPLSLFTHTCAISLHVLWSVQQAGPFCFI